MPRQKPFRRREERSGRGYLQRGRGRCYVPAQGTSVLRLGGSAPRGGGWERPAGVGWGLAPGSFSAVVSTRLGRAGWEGTVVLAMGL